MAEELVPQEQSGDSEPQNLGDLLHAKIDELWPLVPDNELVKPVLTKFYPNSAVTARSYQSQRNAIHLYKVDEGTDHEREGFGYSAPADGVRPDLPDRGLFRYEITADGSVQGYVEDEPYEVNRAAFAEFIKTTMRQAERS